MTQKVNLARGLLILDEDDFELLRINEKIVHMTHTLGGNRYSIVLFYTDDCPECKILKPVLLRFVGHPDIQVCFLNVYDPDSPTIIEKSRKTSTPLEHVPFVVFYINGVPFKTFDGEYNFQDFQKFIKNVITEASKIQDTSKISEIPPYTTGKPNCSKVCYLTYNQAY